jgi:hypothetical protein
MMNIMFSIITIFAPQILQLLSLMGGESADKEIVGALW